eukprot:gene23333-24742_t
MNLNFLFTYTLALTFGCGRGRWLSFWHQSRRVWEKYPARRGLFVVARTTVAVNTKLNTPLLIRFVACFVGRTAFSREAARMSGFGAKEEDDLLGQARVLLTFPGGFANEAARARDGFGTRPEFVARSHAADPALSERVFEALEVVKSASDTLEELARRNRTLEADASRAVTVFRDRAEKATRDLAE